MNVSAPPLAACVFFNPKMAGGGAWGGGAGFDSAPVVFRKVYPLKRETLVFCDPENFFEFPQVVSL